MDELPLICLQRSFQRDIDVPRLTPSFVSCSLACTPSPLASAGAGLCDPIHEYIDMPPALPARIQQI